MVSSLEASGLTYCPLWPQTYSPVGNIWVLSLVICTKKKWILYAWIQSGHPWETCFDPNWTNKIVKLREQILSNFHVSECQWHLRPVSPVYIHIDLRVEMNIKQCRMLWTIMNGCSLTTLSTKDIALLRKKGICLSSHLHYGPYYEWTCIDNFCACDYAKYLYSARNTYHSHSPLLLILGGKLITVSKWGPSIICHRQYLKYISGNLHMACALLFLCDLTPGSPFVNIV